MVTGSYHHVYLSPHFDDASLSCGGAIHQQVQAGQLVLVVTVCAAPPPPEEPFSPFARQLHRLWGSPDNVVATRQAEDQAAMEILGADYLRLRFTDCIYRGRPQQGEWYYAGDADLFGQVHPADLELASDIVASITELVPRSDQTVLYAPLGVGNHVDHQLARAAAVRLQQQGWEVDFYEDYPYADPHYPFTSHGEDALHTLTATLAARSEANWQPRLRPLSTENLQAKIDSVQAYASQMQVLFGGETEMKRRVRSYARYVGEGRLAERVWSP